MEPVKICTNSRNDTTGYSPYELMFGRQPRLPINLVLGADPDKGNHQTHSQYVRPTSAPTRELFTSCKKFPDNEREKQGKVCKNVRAAKIFEGDRVLVRNMNI